MRYYVYGWYEPCGTCFYIGKGSGNRYKNRTLRNQYWKRIEAKHQGNIDVKILHTGLEEQAAYDIEVRLIAELKPRANLSSGGEGSLGVIPSAETRAKMSASHKGLVYGPGHAEHTRLVHLGRKRTPETIERIRQAKLGTKRSLESRLKQSESSKGRVFTDEHRARLSAKAKEREAARREAAAMLQPPATTDQGQQ